MSRLRSSPGRTETAVTAVTSRVPETGNFIAFTEGHGNIYLAESLGDGTFGTPWLLEDITEGNNYDNPGGIVLDDFNNDGFVDIVTGTSLYKWLWGELYYYENRADGSNTFLPKRSIALIPAYGAIVDMTAADFNNDGNMDFVVSANTYTIYNKLHLFFGNGDGTFIEEILPNPAGIDKYRGKTSGDVNGDGNIDIVAVDKNGRIYLYLNNGNGTFMPPVVIGNCGDAPSGVATGDFDEDGHADIIVRGYYHGTKLLKGSGDGTFGAPAAVTSLEPGDSAHFATGDFNNDGHLDIIASVQTKMAIKAYLGKGDGTFVQTPLLGVTTSYAAGIDASPAIPELYPALAAPEPAPPRTFQFIWNTGNASPGVYRIRAVLEESEGLVTEDIAVFEILPDIRVGARVVTDNTSYGSGESVTVISTINGLSENTIIENLSAVVTVTDDQGGILHTDDYNAPILAPGQLMEHKTYWDTAAHQPGVYTVTVTIVHGDTLLRTAATTFEILGSSVTGAGLTGEITAEPDTADWGDDVAVQYSVVNGGNEDIADLQTTVLVVDPDIPEIQETLNGSADIVINGSAAGSGSVSTSNLSLGTYVALLRVSSDSMAEPKTLASAAFTVVDGTPPAVALISPEPASYCNSPITLAVSSTDDASGTASVEYRVDDGAWIPLTLTDGDIYSYTWIPASSDEGTRTITYRATDNAGNVSDPISITITVDLTPPDAPIIISPRDGYVSVKPTVTIEGAAEPLSTIEMVQKGITYRVTASDTGDFVFDGVALDRGDNAFEFTATDRAGNSSEETHHIITYTPIEISEGASELLNLLAWINSGHNEGYRHNDYCENRGLLETLIAGLTDSYTIVCDKKDFQKEMRNPFYTDVLIIGDRHTLEDHFGDELMEKIHGGMGIVSSKLHLHGDYGDDEERHGKYDPVFGVRHRGYLREGDYHTIETEESPITAGGEILEIAGGSAKIEVAGRTTVAGWIKKSPKLKAQSSQRKEDNTDTAYPAVVLNRYGDGRSVFHAFDVEATLNEITYNAVPDLLKNSLGYVHTAEEDEEIHPYEFIGRRIDLKNMAEEPVQLRIDITPTPGLELYDPASGQWMDDDPWRMELQVPALETSSLTYYAFTPDTAGTYTVDVNILFKDGAEYTLFETVRKEITVRNSIEDLIEEITTDLSSIEDAEDAQEIREHLEGVRTRYTGPQKDVGKAIHECLMAVKQAKKRHYEDIRVKLNGLLESLEGLWFFGGSD